jgi:hypothetical protein
MSQELTQVVGIDETPDIENAEVLETPPSSAEELQDVEVDPAKMLGIDVESKPEHFEPEAPISENLPGFDPPEPTIELPPLGTARKTSAKAGVDVASETAASMAIEVVDVVVPLAIDHFIAKEGNPEQYSCNNPDRKEKAKKATARYLGEMNVEISPLWEMVFAVSLMYVEPVMNALQVAKLKRENEEQKKQLDESEKQRIEEKKKRIELEKRLNETDLENAEIAKNAAEAKLQAKRIQDELDAADAPKKPKKPTKRKPTKSKTKKA